MGSDDSCLCCLGRGAHLVCIHSSFHQSGRSALVPVRAISDTWTFFFFFKKQLIGELGITGGDDRKIGYYAGLIVGAHTFTQMVPYSYLRRNPSFSSRRHSRRGNGADYLILSVADPLFYLVCSVSVCLTLPLACRGPWACSSSGW